MQVCDKNTGERKSRFRSQADRDLMVLVMAIDPNVRVVLRQMIRMGVRNIRSDHMYVRKSERFYQRIRDPSCWSGDINQHVGVMMLRDSESGSWWLNGF
jgi:hypothetical protein